MNFKNIKILLINPYIILVIITILSLSPSSGLPKEENISIPNLDKIIHFFMYFVFSFSFLYHFMRKQYEIRKLNILILIFVSFYGIFMEVLQSLMNLGRSASFYDFLANESGIVISFIVFKILFYKKNQIA